MPESLLTPQSIVIGGAVFVAAWDSHNVLRYETRNDQWSVLPFCPVRRLGLGQLSGKLVTVGGLGGSGACSVNHVYTYVQETQQWEKSIPPMPTPRQWPTVITYNSSIAVCGGHGGDRVVEVFNSEAAQWHTAAPLPVARVYMQLTIINDTCYLGGGPYGSSRSIMCASLPSLFQSSSPHEQQTSVQQQSVWTVLPDMPLHGSALANMGGTLLALGGRASPSPPCDAIHAYSTSTKAWVRISSLPQACRSATAELLPSGEVMLIGGGDSKGKWSEAVYIGTLDL